MNWKKYLWPAVALATVVFSVRLLQRELRGVSLADLEDGFEALPASGWMLAGLCTVLAYAALSGYDGLALRHLGKRISWGFVTLCSFTTYALSHNVGASVFSGALVRYRAYASKGLTAAEVGVLVALCSATFGLSVILLMGLLLVIRPELMLRFADVVPMGLSEVTGYILLGIVGLYVLGSFLRVPHLKLGPLTMVYPAPQLVARQLVIGPLELLAAGGIIYFALPEASNPGYIVVLAVFLASFSAALLSHVPGGLGVLEAVFLLALPEADPADVLVALLVFRLFYLIIPFLGALVVILLFERSRLGDGLT